MTDLEALALVAGILALAAAGLFMASLWPRVVTGPRWLAVAIVVVLTGGWAALWFLAQAQPPPPPGILPTVTVSAVAVVAAMGGGPLATAALRLVDPREDVPSPSQDTGDAGQPPAQRPDGPASPDLLRNGAVVGLLERASILALLLIGYPEGVTIILAVKGLGRFGELRIPSAPERFIVGTLTSVLWSILGYAAIRAVLN